MCSASEPTANPAARARTPTSAPGNRPRDERGRSSGTPLRPAVGRAPGATGFTLVELLVVLALIAIASSLASLALRDPAAGQLEREALRLSALLESARAESRASGVAVRFELAPAAISGSGFAGPYRFVGLPPALAWPERWLDDEVSAEIIGARALKLGPEPLIGPQRIVLRLGERNLVLATDGLSPFAPVDATASEPVGR